ncbi:MBL fold metallo-hydrolase [Neolewinella aurantiaca]|uniref:MBL fold metallo-hydrolase n=1 Tax=Neolewinella aurantiaca TaxID=2602767 RepID=A0A5C7FXU9_9BACT|nr:MBL fold metallo-hydrolase [Neolewinella aurantiaca]TXF91641.1 MBL fold metallo-hydrolase [Neolewinella aurantiaca]
MKNDLITRLTTVLAGTLELDGGAMFGVVPQSVWSKAYPPEPGTNRCTWAMRCLLIETGDGRKILVDTGIGEKDDERFRKHFNPSVPQVLASGLKEAMIRPEEITDVLFTHLHFDHVGGASYLDEKGKAHLTFPNATHWVSGKHWNWANTPNAREAASFLPSNLNPLKDSGKLRFLPDQDSDFEWLSGIRLRTVYGHTEAMQLPLIDLPDGRKLAYCADLIPSAAHLSLPWVMAFDVRPLSTLEEKKRLLRDALAGDWTLLLEHDAKVAGGRLAENDRGRLTLTDTFDSFNYKG